MPKKGWLAGTLVKKSNRTKKSARNSGCYISVRFRIPTICRRKNLWFIYLLSRRLSVWSRNISLVIHQILLPTIGLVSFSAQAAPLYSFTYGGLESTGSTPEDAFQDFKAQLGWPFTALPGQQCRQPSILLDATLGPLTRVSGDYSFYAITWIDIGVVCDYGVVIGTKGGSRTEETAWRCNAPPPRKIIAIDPGHGFTCAAPGLPPGTIGVTDFPASDPPPGRLKEDELTMAIAREFQRLASSKYTVVLTKTSATTCPEYEKRGKVAIRAEADVFVSIHINQRNPIPFNPFANGTSAIYNSSRPAAARTLAELMASSVSASLGVNNRGTKVDDKLAVLKNTVTPKMTAVLIEAARLSGSDEEKLYAADSATKVAAGIKAALDAYFGN